MNVNHPNRNRSRQARQGLFWCSHCDHDLVGKGGKCKHCGKRVKSPRATKEAPDADEQLVGLRDPEPSPED